MSSAVSLRARSIPGPSSVCVLLRYARGRLCVTECALVGTHAKELEQSISQGHSPSSRVDMWAAARSRGILQSYKIKPVRNLSYITILCKNGLGLYSSLSILQHHKSKSWKIWSLIINSEIIYTRKYLFYVNDFKSNHYFKLNNNNQKYLDLGLNIIKKLFNLHESFTFNRIELNRLTSLSLIYIIAISFQLITNFTISATFVQDHRDGPWPEENFPLQWREEASAHSLWVCANNHTPSWSACAPQP